MQLFNLWLKKTDCCRNKPERSLTTKIGEYIPCWYSISTILLFDNLENKHSSYRGEDWMKKFCISLREHAADVINFWKDDFQW